MAGWIANKIGLPAIGSTRRGTDLDPRVSEPGGTPRAVGIVVGLLTRARKPQQRGELSLGRGLARQRAARTRPLRCDN